MTLLLAAKAADSVIICADSHAWLPSSMGPVGCEARKLFARWDFGIATAGAGPPDVPDVIPKLPGSPKSVGEAAKLVTDRFNQYTGMSAFVGGVDATGPVLLTVDLASGMCLPEADELGQPQTIKWKGIDPRPIGIDLTAKSAKSELVEQMFEIQRRVSAIVSDVGPPFEILILTREAPEWIRRN